MTVKHGYHPDTLCLHAGQEPDPATGARAVPIYQTTSFVFKDTDQAARLFELKEEGHIYSRISNPTVDVVEKRVAALEGGVGALLVASGMAAELIIFSVLARQGDNIVSSSSLYGGTKTILGVSLPRFGITAKFFDLRAPESATGLIDDRTKALYVETVGNPAGDVADLEAYARIAHAHRLPARRGQHVRRLPLPARSNGGPTSSSIRPPNSSAGTGRPSGGSSWTAGASLGTTADSPNSRSRPRAITTLKFWETFKETDVHRQVPGGRASAPSGPPPPRSTPSSSCRGSKRFTCASRDTARTRRAWPGTSPPIPKVAWVSYAGLPGHPSHELARKYLKGGFGLHLHVRGQGRHRGREEGHRGGQADLPPGERRGREDPHSPPRVDVPFPALRRGPAGAAGVTPDMIRLSVGIEHADDIIADLDQALARI